MHGEVVINNLRIAVAPQVIHESIDGEVIIINLSTGTYYSLKGTAAVAWGLIEGSGGVAAEDLVDAFEQHYGQPREQVESALTPFLEEVEAEGLVVRSNGVEGSDATVRVAANGTDPSFEPPVVEKFTDMQDLVLLDPVHEVQEMGWPLARPDDAAAGAGQ